MSLKTVHLRSLFQLNPPDCYQFDLQVSTADGTCVACSSDTPLPQKSVVHELFTARCYAVS